jgi:hypothetical protein
MTKLAYKLAHVDKAEIALAARKALMIADSHYFAWPAKQQEHFRATMSEKAQQKVQRVLIDDLLGIKCSLQELDNTLDEIPFSKLNIINWAKLLTQGIGEDYIDLNEYMAEGKSLLDFSTLHDYDYDDYLFQEEAKKQDIPDYRGVDYFAYQHPSWVRLLIQEQFYYASFMSLATYCLDEIVSAGDDHIDQLIPHDYVDGKNQDILKNFDPKVTKLRKKMKIILTPRVLEDLAKIDTDDPSLK